MCVYVCVCVCVNKILIQQNCVINLMKRIILLDCLK